MATHPEQERYIGIDIGGTNIKYGAITGAGHIEWRHETPTSASGGAESLLAQLQEIGSEMISRSRREGKSVDYLGVVTPGAVDFARGVIVGKSPNIPGWEGTALGPRLAEKLGLPVLVENDARAMAIGEHTFGAARGCQSAVCVTLGTGVGGAIIIGGELWRGASHSAGEIGHLVVDLQGEFCKCGQQGCLETVASAGAIVRRAQKALAGKLTEGLRSSMGPDGNIEKLSVRDIFAAAEAGDQFSQQIIAESAVLLGRALAGIVNFVNPEIVVIGGGVADGSPDFVAQVEVSLRKWALPSAASALRVLKAELGNSAGFVGAAALGVKNSRIRALV